ncbi:MAG: hypothetical protein ABSA39_18475 [Edaphobacter sp.]
MSYYPAEIYMEHNGVIIYHVYKADDPDQGIREYWFDTQEASRDDYGFDVRELAEELVKLNPILAIDASGDDEKKSIIRASIEAGLLQAA